MTQHVRRFSLAACLSVLVAASALAQERPAPVQKSESFDRDPGWEGVKNRVVPERMPTIVQDFGYRMTSFVGKGKGEIGGQVWRASEPAWYADKIAKSLNDKLSASGTFSVPKGGSGGVLFGWFSSKQVAGSARPVSSLGLQIGGARNGIGLHIRLHTADNQACGIAITPEEGVKHRRPLRNDGTRYSWQLDYDPEANGNRGRITFSLRSNSAKPEPFEGKNFIVNLPDGYRKQGAIFDRFGLMNIMKPGGQLTVYFADVRYDGRAPDLATDPNWDGHGNRARYQAKETGGAQDFGFTDTSHFGGKKGEIGGAMWRTAKDWGYYADRIGTLSLDNRLEAKGKVFLEAGAPDSGMYLGWFKGGPGEHAPTIAGNFLGVKVAGPSRAGHYFQPAYTTAKATPRAAGKGPLLIPGRVYEWALLYNPLANSGNGSLRVILGQETVQFDLKKGDRAEGARFDRFGLLSNNNAGGHAQVKIFFDDLQYTVRR